METSVPPRPTMILSPTVLVPSLLPSTFNILFIFNVYGTSTMLQAYDKHFTWIISLKPCKRSMSYLLFSSFFYKCDLPASREILNQVWLSNFNICVWISNAIWYPAFSFSMSNIHIYLVNDWLHLSSRTAWKCKWHI